MRDPQIQSAIGNRQSAMQPAFTLVEMLTVIGIIVLLVSILLPVVSAVRTKGHQADTQAMLARIAAGIESYSSDFKSYPGPLHNGQIYNGGMPVSISVATGGATLDATKITQSENLVLGLLGGLTVVADKLTYDDTLTGNGPVSLNSRAPKKYRAYMDKVSLSGGDYKDDVGDADDTVIREFVDRFSDPMPILYMRANVGASGIVSRELQFGAPQEQYDLKQIKAYTSSEPGKNIGVGKEAPPDSDFKPSVPGTQADKLKHGLREVRPDASIQDPPPTGAPPQRYYYPYDLYGFMRHPSMPASPRQKNGYILISAGPDRIYGTKDDAVYPASR